MGEKLFVALARLAEFHISDFKI